MLSRFPSLFTYLIVGLVVSAAATPFTNPLGDATKSLSPRPNSMKPMDNRKPYDGDKGRPYRNDDKEGPYRDGDKDKHYDDDRSEHHGQCSVENQHCCNQVNEASDTSKLETLSKSIFGLLGVIEFIKKSDQLWGFDCSPFLGFNSACKNQQVCCEDNHMNGLIVVGCNNINFI